ncbi:MAG: copper-binding protein [Phycisphaerales bacterium]|nr:copper-binding protein [Phycisphaerales bacterium]
MHAALRLVALMTILPLVASCGEQPQAKKQTQAPISPIEAKPEANPSTTTETMTPPSAEVKPEAKPETKPEPKPEAPAVPANPTYSTRGEIVSLPGIEGDALKLHHERIPTFANKDGKVGKDSQGKPGMKPMTMPFGKSPGVSYEGLKIGDKIAVVFEVNWAAERPDQRIVITKVEKLAADTKLDFEGQPSINDPKPTTPPKEPK